jgi:hypothetical protein
LPAPAQEGTLDLLDGETLYEGGWLVTLTYELERRERLLAGEMAIFDALDRRRTDHTATVAAHHWLRNFLQLSALFPYVYRRLDLRTPQGPERLEADGPGDLTLAAKWRFWRWDAPHQALNLAALAGLQAPSGAAGERRGGELLDPELQPGSGAWSPLTGLAATYEPYRWRFNAFVLYQPHFGGRQGYEPGDELFAEISAGNRFWLEPYPGPFLRGDLLLRYRGEQRALRDGLLVRDSGGDLLTAGANLAFRPRPSLDFQLAVEFPLYERLNGEQLGRELSLAFSFGYRF